MLLCSKNRQLSVIFYHSHVDSKKIANTCQLIDTSVKTSAIFGLGVGITVADGTITSLQNLLIGAKCFVFW